MTPPDHEDASLEGAAHRRYECGICWYIYDPTQGDDVWQIPPGVPFSELPDQWRCPNCDADKARFMAMPEE
ncbi:MAG: rubredoxin [Gammaproteobacteria bacterium]